MAKLVRRLVFVMLLTGPQGVTAIAEQRFVADDLPSPESVKAYKRYWDAFERYERKTQEDAERSRERSLATVKRSYMEKKSKLDREQITLLKRAADRYEDHLKSHTNAHNRPYVLLNLAQIKNLLADHLGELGDTNANFARTEALAYLQEIEEKFPDFSHIEETLYLHAVVSETLSLQDEALSLWQRLAQKTTKTIYGVHARLALGDYFFKRDEPVQALRYYRSALVSLESINYEDKRFEEHRIHYRIAWSAYRSAEIIQVVTSGKKLLGPGAALGDAADHEKITQDAIELVANALYENNDLKFARETLEDRTLQAHASTIGYVTIRRYSANEIHSEAKALGIYLLERFPMALEIPEIVQIVARAYEAEGQNLRRIETLETLANLLPADSLWRAKHRDQHAALASGIEKAEKAAILVASSYYEQGLNTGNANHFRLARAQYESLISHSPNGRMAGNWRLKKAHCHYFSDSLEDAEKSYEEIITTYKSDDKVLQIAGYQLVLTREKLWRRSFANVVNAGEEPTADPGVVQRIDNLEKGIEAYVAKYPKQGRSVDLLLVGASANRDQDRLDRAAGFWQKALVANPSAAQRGVAIRGLIFAKMKTAGSGDVLQLTKQFLQLENWSDLGLNLDRELKGVLSAAALDEGSRLNENGKVREAGAMLVQVAKEFPDIPNREKVFRNGAYMLAIAGDWRAAEDAADEFLAGKPREFIGDMLYLQGRAHEFQFRLSKAANIYLTLGQRYPDHVRAEKALQTAQKLAEAEGDYELAAKAAETLGNGSKRYADKMRYSASGIAMLEKAGQHDRASEMARRRFQAAKVLPDRFESDLMMARNAFRSGADREGEALEQLRALSLNLKRSQRRLPEERYAAIAGETFFLLGEEARQRFEDFDIFERSGGVGPNVRRKTEYFEELVKQYAEAVSCNHPDWSTAASYQIAQAAERLSADIGSIPKRSGERQNQAIQDRYAATVQRLQELAQRYYSANVLLSRREPGKYRDNVWVRRSSMKLSGQEAGASPDGEASYELPAASRAILPATWSL